MRLTSVMAMISCTHKPQITPVSFSKDIIPVFTAGCTINSSCHLGANGLNQDVDLDSAEAWNTIISKGLVSVADPSASLLYVEVNSNGTGFADMPKPPAAALPASQQALILEWIQQGAKDN